ncbi:MAG: DNA-protecting protein DprA [Candidatus Moranbacteria bacterium]|nr:DNA-protecting protein DprA [Candidatus Moranbacteria bacterium]
MKYLNALFIIEGVGNQKISTLLNHFDSAKEAWQASEKELVMAGMPEKLATTIVEKRKTIDPEKHWAILEKESISIITIKDEHYPKLLREIPSPPYLLYAKGNIDVLKLPMISIVGSRKFTAYGRQITTNFAKQLCEAGFCVVSGLALGIDAIAHSGALDVGGKTIAVLGNSLDDINIYPRNNFALAQEIIANNGLLLSEFPVPTHANVSTFPIRNRIVAGLSYGTLVTEAAEKSGSLITANFAVEFGREVFAVPGNISSLQSEGANSLIKKGAKMTTGLSDILEEIKLQTQTQAIPSSMPLELTENEESLLHFLSSEPTHIDRIIKLTKLEASSVISNLSILEIKGVIKNIGGQNYIRI